MHSSDLYSRFKIKHSFTSVCLILINKKYLLIFFFNRFSLPSSFFLLYHCYFEVITINYFFMIKEPNTCRGDFTLSVDLFSFSEITWSFSNPRFGNSLRPGWDKFLSRVWSREECGDGSDSFLDSGLERDWIFFSGDNPKGREPDKGGRLPKKYKLKVAVNENPPQNLLPYR